MKIKPATSFFAKGVVVTNNIVYQRSVWNVIQQNLLLFKYSFDSVLVIINLLGVCNSTVKSRNTDYDQENWYEAVGLKNNV